MKMMFPRFKKGESCYMFQSQVFYNKILQMRFYKKKNFKAYFVKIEKVNKLVFSNLFLKC